MIVRMSLSLVALVLVASCADVPAYRVVGEDPTDIPVAGSTAEDVDLFVRGDALFNATYRPSQGLGPLFVRSSCQSCHAEAGRGPGAAIRMSAVEADGFTRARDQGAFPWGDQARPQFTADATRGVQVPEEAPGILVSWRLGPAVFGRGWIEAVEDAEIERVEQEQAARGGAVSGRIHRLPDGSIGRFGLKARIATLEEFTADAFLTEMGLTTTRRPTELPNPDGLVDDLRPGVDIGDDVVRQVTGYVRRLAIPRRRGRDDQGGAFFERVGCVDCHTPTLRTRADYPLAPLAGTEAWIYSDLLLHDMGTGLADGIVEGRATEREWRTSPLIGVRFQRSYLHDGRARTVEEAIRMHWTPGSEAIRSVNLFASLRPDERRALVEFVRGL
jgi:CxxC motif-containing protein (DUF1111 family)